MEGDFHRIEPRGYKVKVTKEAVANIGLEEWDIYISALHAKRRALDEEYYEAIEIRKQLWQADQQLL